MTPTRRRSAVAVNIIPLVDVLVVLVFFLLVTLRAGDPRALQVTPPTAASGAAASLESAVVLAVDAEGGLFLDSHPVAPAALAPALRAALEGKPDPEVVVAADRRARTGDTVRALDAAAQAGARVQVQVLPETSR
jgi:biopolymer transport protein ExbD